MHNDHLLPSAEACDRLQCDRSTLSRWVASGRIVPALRGPGLRGAMFFRPADVDALAAELDKAMGRRCRPMHNDHLLPSAEACDRLQCDRSTLSRWVASGRIVPALRGPGLRGAMFFRPADVDALAAELDKAMA